MSRAQYLSIDDTTRCRIYNAYDELKDQPIPDGKLFWSIFENIMKIPSLGILPPGTQTLGFVTKLLDDKNVFFYVEYSEVDANEHVLCEDALSFYADKDFTSQLDLLSYRHLILKPARVLSDVMPRSKCFKLVSFEACAEKAEEQFAFQ